jgi:hypothetical protein
MTLHEGHFRNPLGAIIAQQEELERAEQELREWLEDLEKAGK